MSAAMALLAIAVLALGGFLAWSFFFSPVTVPVVTVQSNVPQEVFGLGTVSARIQSKVGFKVAGVLVELKADQGDRVRAGQVLARLDARDVEAQLALAKAGVAQARANVEKAKADVTSASASLDNAKAISVRRTSMAKSGFTSQEEAQTNEAAVRVAAATLASAQSGVDVAEAALQSAEAQESFQEATLSNYTLYAPYDAWIVSRNLELGSMPNPGQAVFNLVAAHTVWVLAYVDERLAGRLSVGQPAKVILRSNPRAPIPGRIERIEIQSDAVNEERLVNVAFDDVPDDIHLAEQAEVVITTGALPRAVLVQPSAVKDFRADHGADGHGTIWTVEGGRVERRQVTFGPALLDGRLPVLDGLPANAAVVAAPVAGLRVGRGAHVVETVTP
jgi:HlyD family secretion protein